MSEPKGLFKMKFVGRPNGKLMKNAPGNFTHGEVYNVPYNHAQWDFWELLDETPVLKAPPVSDVDDVYDETVEEPVFKPEEVPEVTLSAPLPEEEPIVEPQPEASIEEVAPVVHGEDINVDPNTMATIEPYMVFNTGTGELTDYDDPLPEQEPEVADETNDAVVEYSRDELLKILADADVEVKKRTRTTTLRKMVDKLVSEE